MLGDGANDRNLENTESLIDFVGVGPRFSAAVLTTLLSKLRTPPPEGKSRVIIATSNKYTVMSQLDVLSVFDRLITVDIVRGPAELFKLLSAFRSDDGPKAIVSRLLESYDPRLTPPRTSASMTAATWSSRVSAGLIACTPWRPDHGEASTTKRVAPKAIPPTHHWTRPGAGAASHGCRPACTTRACVGRVRPAPPRPPHPRHQPVRPTSRYLAWTKCA